VAHIARERVVEDHRLSKVLLDELGLRHEQVIRPRDGDVRLVVCNGLEER
jgi:hypothetical protein